MFFLDIVIICLNDLQFVGITKCIHYQIWWVFNNFHYLLDDGSNLSICIF